MIHKVTFPLSITFNDSNYNWLFYMYVKIYVGDSLSIFIMRKVCISQYGFNYVYFDEIK